MSEQKLIPIAKIDDEKRLVFGWANVSVRKSGETIVDHQGHFTPIEELEPAAYEFALSYRDAGGDHTKGYITGQMVESVVITKEKLQMWGLAPNAMPEGWWIGFHVDDDTAWEKVKKGDYRMFSIEGVALPEEVASAD